MEDIKIQNEIKKEFFIEKINSIISDLKKDVKENQLKLFNLSSKTIGIRNSNDYKEINKLLNSTIKKLSFVLRHI